MAQKAKDILAVAALLATHTEHKFYGVRRLSDELGWNPKKTRRIRSLAGLVVEQASKKRRTGKTAKPEISAPENALAAFAVSRDVTRPQDGMDYSAMIHSGGWVQDFTYLWFERSWVYLAVILDLKTRQVVGWSLGLSHSSELTYKALLDALSRHKSPTILHSDQGSEYLSTRHQALCQRMGITLSCSAKSSPWQNGYMERWFETLKLELGQLNQFENLPQLHEGIALTIHYYNTKRIHTALKMPPAVYAERLKGQVERDIVSGIWGA